MPKKSTPSAGSVSVLSLNDNAALLEPLRLTIRTALRAMVAEELRSAVVELTQSSQPPTMADAEEVLKEAIASRNATPQLPRQTNVCAFAGCALPARAKGLCSAHYQAERRRVKKAAPSKRKVKTKAQPAGKKRVRKAVPVFKV